MSTALEGKTCRKCGAALDPTNIYPSYVTRRDYRCKSCAAPRSSAQLPTGSVATQVSAPADAPLNALPVQAVPAQVGTTNADAVERARLDAEIRIVRRSRAWKAMLKDGQFVEELGAPLPDEDPEDE